MKAATISLFITFWLGACSSQQVYTAIQENRKSECMKLPPSAYDECIEGYTKSYTEYEKERAKLVRDKK